MQVLSGTDLRTTPATVLLIEDFWLQPVPRTLDVYLGQNGYIKFHQMAIDSVFVQKDFAVDVLRQPTWYPPQFDADVQFHVNWVKQTSTQTALKAAWGFQ